jgi:hypothetical protein
MKRAVPIKPENSTVLGYNVTGYYLDWWNQCADWRGALPCKTNGFAHAPLNVRCKRWWRWNPVTKRKVLWRDGSEWYRVLPRLSDSELASLDPRNGYRAIERRNGVWYWVPRKAGAG